MILRILFVLVLFFAGPVFAADGISINVSGNDIFSSGVVQLVALVSILSLAPSIIVTVTSFGRIVIVLSLLRSGIGLQQTPPNVILTSLALFLTFFIMSPTLESAYYSGVEPLMKKTMSVEDAAVKIAEPFRDFMMHQVQEEELSSLANIAGLKKEDMTKVPFRVLIPAFILSELKKAFEIGFLIFLPFLVIDLVISSVLMSMGMMMLPPASISLPFKIIFFVLIDGWTLLSESLVKGFH